MIAFCKHFWSLSAPLLATAHLTRFSNPRHLRTLGDLVREHGGGGGGAVSILKVDTEGAEWGALETALKEGLFARGAVQQLLVEYHLPPLHTQPHAHSRYEYIFCELRRQGMIPWHEHRPTTDSMEYSYIFVPSQVQSQVVSTSA